MGLKFRRNVAPAGKMGGRVIALIIAAGFLVLLFFIFSTKWFSVPSERKIYIEWLSPEQIIIDRDTTFFDAFASTLIDSVQQAKSRYQYIYLYPSSPKNASVSQIADFMQVVQALDDGKRVRIEWKTK